MRAAVILCAVSVLLARASSGRGSDYRDTFYGDKNTLLVSRGDEIVDRLPCERMPLDYPDLNGRAQANVAPDSKGGIWAAVGYDVGGRGVERLFYSEDGGRSWTSQILPHTQELEVAAFTVLKDDTLLLALSKHNTEDRNGIKIFASRDKGQTWDLVTGLVPAPFRYIGEGFMSLTQLRDGRVLFPVTRWFEPDKGVVLDKRLLYHSVYVSTDGGKTFPAAYSTFPDCAEAHILELQSGRLLCAIRYQRERIADDTEEKVAALGGTLHDKDRWVFKHVFLGDSDDGGITWKNFRPLVNKQGKPLLGLSECHGQLFQMADGRVVLTHDLRVPFDHGEIRARVSRDAGQTWEPEIYHVSYGHGYCSSTVLKDGTIVTVTGNMPYRNKPPVYTKPWRAQVIRWKLP